MIGNLIPLSKELNEQAGDKPLERKISIYEQSEFILTEEFVHELQTIYGGEWNSDNIINRTDRLAGEAYTSLWNH